MHLGVSGTFMGMRKEEMATLLYGQYEKMKFCETKITKIQLALSGTWQQLEYMAREDVRY